MIVKEILFDENIKFEFSYLDNLDLFIPVASFFIILAAIISLNYEENPIEIIKRFFVGLILLAMISPTQKILVDYSFTAADKVHSVITNNQSLFGQGSIFRSYYKFKYEVINQNEGWSFGGVGRFLKSFIDYGEGGFRGTAIGFIREPIGATFLKIIQFLVMFSFVVLKAVYMSIYYLNIVLIALPALIYILPGFKSTFNVPIATSLWLFCHPFVVVVIIALMDALAVSTIAENNRLNFDTAILIGAFSIILFSSIAMTAGIISGTGMVSAVGSAAAIAGPQVALMKGRAATMLALGPLGPKAAMAKGLMTAKGLQIGGAAGTSLFKGMAQKAGEGRVSKVCNAMGDKCNDFHMKGIQIENDIKKMNENNKNGNNKKHSYSNWKSQESEKKTNALTTHNKHGSKRIEARKDNYYRDYLLTKKARDNQAKGCR